MSLFLKLDVFKSCVSRAVSLAAVLLMYQLVGGVAHACPFSNEAHFLPQKPSAAVASSARSALAASALADDSDASYDMRVLLITYFPLSKKNKIIDSSYDPLSAPNSVKKMKTLVNSIVSASTAGLERASKYRGYADATAEPALRYSVVKRVNYFEALPWKVMQPEGSPEPLKYLNYSQIIQRENICDLVDNQGVNEVWLFKGTSKLGYSQMESKMSGPHGDVSNSFGWSKGDLPVCSKTYRVYTHDFGRYENFLEVWGHQFEVELQHVASSQLGGYALLSTWFGPCDGNSSYDCHPATNLQIGRCGNAHNPPNARYEYDRNNPNSNLSDCMDWNPDGLGALSYISCENWGCGGQTAADNYVLNYSVWLWQNLPGRNNNKSFQGNKLRNWWAVHGDWDNIVAARAGLMLNGVSVDPVSPPPAPAIPKIVNKGKVTTMKLQKMPFVKYEVQLVHTITGEARYPTLTKPTAKFKKLSAGKWRIRYRFIEDVSNLTSRYSTWLFFTIP